MYRDVSGSAMASGATASQRMLQGSGVSVSSIVKSFADGEIKQTDSQYDVAIRGDGFIEVVDADGTLAYMRGGTLHVDKDGFLVTATGQNLKSSVRVGADAKDITITADGRVLARAATQTTAAEVGKIDLVRFADVSGLEAMGDNLYRPTERSGDAIAGTVGEDGVGVFAQGFLEASNVNLVREMVDLMVAQRAYESNTKVIQASDEMLAMSHNLRK
jgi:flagellar basal-body rod protein FlgG